MPRACTICTHADRSAIDRALVGGNSAPRIAAEYRVSDDAVLQHKAHIAAQIQGVTTEDTRRAAALAQQQASQEAQEVRQALDVVQQLKTINGVSLAILKAARDEANHKLALLAIDRVQRQIELQARLLGDLDDRPVVNILVNPQWIELRTVILGALAPYSEARVAVAAALRGFDAR